MEERQTINYELQKDDDEFWVDTRELWGPQIITWFFVDLALLVCWLSQIFCCYNYYRRKIRPLREKLRIREG